MDNPVFVHDGEITLINDYDYDYEESRYDTSETSRIEEKSFTTEHTTKQSRW